MLIERYLEPLKSENYIPQEEVCAVTPSLKTLCIYLMCIYVCICLQLEIVSGNIVEIVEVQKKFLKSLEVSFNWSIAVTHQVH